MQITIFFGGNNEEKGISINSARAVFEFLKNCSIEKNKLEISLIYVDSNNFFYKVPSKYIYSNTPDDFSFLLNSIENFWNVHKIDFAIPLIHGDFGEDGQIQKLLESNNIPFLFSSSSPIKEMFLKKSFYDKLFKNGFNSWDVLLKSEEKDNTRIEELQKIHGEIVLKPNNGGSSSHVFISKDYLETTKILKNKSIDFIIEEKHIGQEFSIAVLNGVAQIPVEIDTKNKIFDYRKKYFPSEDVKIQCFPSFLKEIIENIQRDCEKIFTIFEAKDAIRIDGWLLKDNKVIYTDCNPISSMELNGIFFQSIPENPKEIFLNMLNSNLEKNKLPVIGQKNKNKIDLPVIFGGNSSEKNVSLLSGGNVVIKFLNSNIYNPIPYFLHRNTLYELPIFMIFKHSTEDLLDLIRNIKNYEKIIGKKVIIKRHSINKIKYPKVFLALHGGDGENGVTQKILEDQNIKFNGSNSQVSKLCMNKMDVANICENNIKEIIKINRFFLENKLENPEYFKDLGKRIKFPVFVKPSNDGSSSGVCKIENIKDLEIYHRNWLGKNNSVMIGDHLIQLPENRKTQQIIVEDFILTAKIEFLKCNSLSIQENIGWIELTIGFLNNFIFFPSITVCQRDFLTAEEKFQEGTGINLTPPPQFLINNFQIERIKNIIKKIIALINLKGYSRIDFFFNRFTNEFILIEINTLPALTFATVLFSQAIYDNIEPETLLEKIIE